MPDPFNCSIGGIAISLIPEKASDRYSLIKKTINFVNKDAPEVALQVHCGHFPKIEDPKQVFKTNHTWEMFTQGDRQVIKVRSPQRDPYQVGVFSKDFRSGDIYVASDVNEADSYVFPLSYPMGELYTMNLLGTGLGMIFHASGVIYEGEGYLFTGHGGVGKSTTARLWQEHSNATVVNDDKVIVRKKDGQIYLYGTPWHGEGGMALPDSAPLKKVFVLKQAHENYIRPIPPAELTAKLLVRTFSPLWDEEKVAFLLSFLEELGEAVPCMELGFLPDRSAVDFVLAQ